MREESLFKERMLKINLLPYIFCMASTACVSAVAQTGLERVRDSSGCSDRPMGDYQYID